MDRCLTGGYMFCEEKVAQMAAYLLQRRGGRMSYLKLMKLLYLADRESMGRFGESMSGDHMVSMPKGPVLSQTLNLITGSSCDSTNWQSWINGEANYEVSIKKVAAARDDFDELSNSDLKILDSVFEKFGHMKRFELVEYTHANCAEWQDPNGSSYPIKPESVFLALGKDEKTAGFLAKNVVEQQQLESFLAKLR